MTNTIRGVAAIAVAAALLSACAAANSAKEPSFGFLVDNATLDGEIGPGSGTTQVLIDGKPAAITGTHWSCDVALKSSGYVVELVVDGTVTERSVMTIRY